MGTHGIKTHLVTARERRLRKALVEALDLFAVEFIHNSDGSLVVDHRTGEPYNVGGYWVKRARAALADDAGEKGQNDE
jgi:hypothetical protein